MGVFESVVRLEVVSADVAAFLCAANAQGMELRDVQLPDPLTVRFTLPRSKVKTIQKLTKRRGEKLTVLERRGLWWKVSLFRKCPVLVGGLVLLTALALFLPSRVLLVEVEGNTTIPDAMILETARECGIRFGASRRKVRSEWMKNTLLEAMPELSWAGVNTYGSRAVITVGQREIQTEEAVPAVSHIVACRDGYILNCQAEQGTALCTPGQTVTEGQVLISGLTDCGLCVTATRAEGEVYAATNRQIRSMTPAICLQKTGRRRDKVTYSLIVGKNRFNFYKSSGISPASCDRMVTEYTLTLPGGFALPVKLIRQTITALDLTPMEVTEAEAEALLSRVAAEYLSRQMIAGSITAALETVTAEDGSWILTGDYACTEMIGREQAVQNGELHETSGTNRQRGPGG